MGADDHRPDSPHADILTDMLFDLVDGDLAGRTDAEIDVRLDRSLRSLGYGAPGEDREMSTHNRAATPATESADVSVEDAERFWAVTDEFATGTRDDFWLEASAYFVKSPPSDLEPKGPAVQRIYDEAHREAQQIVVNAYIEAQQILTDAKVGAKQALRQAYQSARRITDEARAPRRRNGSPDHPISDLWAS